MKYIVKKITHFNLNEINDFYDTIPKIKKDKIDKYLNYEAKIRSIIGELLLKELLLQRGISYNIVNYYVNDYGKPYIINSNLFFNISHSFDYVITAISDNEIGIDIEKIRKAPRNGINQFATENEKKYILSSDNNIEVRVFEIYTLKEAYFKMLGEDLNRVLEVEFFIENGNIYCSDNRVTSGIIEDIDGYVIAYCEKS